MCGIFGAVSLQGAPLKYSQCVAAMAAALAHRGPDGEQIVGHERARIGARRLAIMDLTTGDQPFRSPDGSVWMVCNGEIYNAPELRRECTQAGYPFRSTGDIETIVPLYERLGPDAVGRLDGPATLRTALLRAVERELMSDVPVGVFTSGGLDSSLLAAAAARVMAGERIHTYAVRFTEPGYDESPYAEAVTHHIRTSHHVVTADEAALERAFATVTRALAEPVGDPAILPTYLLAEAAREHVKVVLSGEGADELFGGYPTYLGHKAAGLYRRVPGRAVLRWLVNRLPTSTGKVTTEFLLKQLVAAAELPVVERHLTWFGALGPDPRAVAWANGLLDGFPTDPSVNRLLWLDFLSYLPDNLLVKVDRGTMLASIEARAPYLDRELLELVLPAPSGLKARGLATKAILKEAARGLVRDDVIRRRKRGLSVPVARWLNAGLATVADRYLAHPRLFPGAPTGRLLAEHRQGTRNHARKLWPILMAELWAERWNVDIAT